MKKINELTLMLAIRDIMVLLFIAFLLSSCATPPNKPICKKVDYNRAYCVNIVSSKPFYWDDENRYEGVTFFDAEPTMILVPPTTWAALKSYILKQCKQSKGCKFTDPQIQTIYKLDRE